jgi:hypothetical protein
MTYTNPGEIFVDRFGPPETIDDVMRYAEFLRDESGVGTKIPIDLTVVYERFGIPLPQRIPLASVPGVTANSDEGIILINDADLPLRQRFSEGHELMELLFTAVPKGKGWAARQRVGLFKPSVKERLCNEGAAELLMPRSSYRPRVCELGVAYRTARQLAAEYRVSLTAALVQMARVGPGSHAVVLWRMKNKPTEIRRTVPANQLSLFESPSLPKLPPQKLRVEWSLANPDAPFIPAHKSVPTDSSIHAAWQDGTFTIGEDYLELGAVRGVCRCENQPFESDGEKQVLSLLHLPHDGGCSWS